MSRVSIQEIRTPLIETARKDLTEFFDRALGGKKVIEGDALKGLEDSMHGDYLGEHFGALPRGGQFTVDQLVESYSAYFDNCVAQVAGVASKTISDDQLWEIGDIDANLHVRIDHACDLMDLQALEKSAASKPRAPKEQTAFAKQLYAHLDTVRDQDTTFQTQRFESIEHFQGETGVELPRSTLEMLLSTQREEIESAAKYVAESASDYNGEAIGVTAQDLINDTVDLGEYEEELEGLPTRPEILFATEADGEPVGAVFSYLMVEHGYTSGKRIIWDARSRSAVAMVQEFASGDPAKWDYLEASQASGDGSSGAVNSGESSAPSTPAVWAVEQLLGGHPELAPLSELLRAFAATDEATDAEEAILEAFAELAEDFDERLELLDELEALLLEAPADTSPQGFPREFGAGKVNTDACREVLAETLGGAKSQWKRGTRKTLGSKVLRPFSNGDNHAVVVATRTQIISVHPVSRRPNGAELEDRSWKRLITAEV